MKQVKITTILEDLKDLKQTNKQTNKQTKNQKKKIKNKKPATRQCEGGDEIHFIFVTWPYIVTNMTRNSLPPFLLRTEKNMNLSVATCVSF